jgi:hypothetical protein
MDDARDTTLDAAMAAAADHIDLLSTKMPYAVLAGAIANIHTLPLSARVDYIRFKDQSLRA